MTQLAVRREAAMLDLDDHRLSGVERRPDFQAEPLAEMLHCAREPALAMGRQHVSGPSPGHGETDYSFRQS